MATTTFQPSIVWRNELLFPASLFNIQVPRGLSLSDVRAPIYVTATEMQRLSPSRTISVVAGLTKTEFSVRFANFNMQWRQVSSRATNQQWQFQGGRIYFQIRIGLYVAEGFQSLDNILSVIMEHELLHVQDEIDIVRWYMRSEAPKDRWIKRYLIDKSPVHESMLDRMFRRNGFNRWVHDGLWAPEHNRRAQSRDSGQEWTDYRERIDALMRGTGSSG